MIGFDPQLTTVILAACSGLALGVVGMRFVDATADRRMMARHKRRAKKMLCESGAGTDGSAHRDAWSYFDTARVRPAPPSVLVQDKVATTRPAVGTAESTPGQQVLKTAVARADAPRIGALPGLPGGADLDAQRVQRLTSGAAEPAPYPGPHLQMRALDHVTEFIDYQRDAHLGRNPRTGRWECRRSSADVLTAYRRWAQARSIVLIPEWQFLNLLAKQPFVEKKRDRLKDANGRVPRTEGGSPERTNYYTIVELPPPNVAQTRRRAA